MPEFTCPYCHTHMQWHEVHKRHRAHCKHCDNHFYYGPGHQVIKHTPLQYTLVVSALSGAIIVVTVIAAFVLWPAGGSHSPKLLSNVLYQNGSNNLNHQTLKALRQAASQNQARAMTKIGDCYYKGQGVHQDYAKAAYWYTKAARLGEIIATYKLGQCYGQGIGVPLNYTRALVWFHKAANGGHPKAMYMIGKYYLKGYSVRQNYTKALDWFHKAADKNNAMAMVEIGICYGQGFGVRRNYITSLRWIRKAWATGDPAACTVIQEKKLLPGN